MKSFRELQQFLSEANGQLSLVTPEDQAQLDKLEARRKDLLAQHTEKDAICDKAEEEWKQLKSLRHRIATKLYAVEQDIYELKKKIDPNSRPRTPISRM